MATVAATASSGSAQEEPNLALSTPLPRRRSGTRKIWSLRIAATSLSPCSRTSPPPLLGRRAEPERRIRLYCGHEVDACPASVDVNLVSVGGPGLLKLFRASSGIEKPETFPWSLDGPHVEWFRRRVEKREKASISSREENPQLTSTGRVQREDDSPAAHSPLRPVAVWRSDCNRSGLEGLVSSKVIREE